MEKYKDTDRHVAPRKVVQIKPEAHKKARLVQRALEVRTGEPVTVGGAVAWALTKAAEELRAK